MACAEIPLREPRDGEIRQDRRVDADAEPPDIVANDRRVEVVHAQSGPLLVNEPERHWDDKTKDVGPRCPLVALPSSEKLVR